MRHSPMVSFPALQGSSRLQAWVTPVGEGTDGSRARCILHVRLSDACSSVPTFELPMSFQRQLIDLFDAQNPVAVEIETNGFPRNSLRFTAFP
jgi:hypothetical protein